MSLLLVSIKPENRSCSWVTQSILRVKGEAWVPDAGKALCLWKKKESLHHYSVSQYTMYETGA